MNLIQIRNEKRKNVFHMKWIWKCHFVCNLRLLFCNIYDENQPLSRRSYFFRHYFNFFHIYRNYCFSLDQFIWLDTMHLMNLLEKKQQIEINLSWNEWSRVEMVWNIFVDRYKTSTVYWFWGNDVKCNVPMIHRSSWFIGHSYCWPFVQQTIFQINHLEHAFFFIWFHYFRIICFWNYSTDMFQADWWLEIRSSLTRINAQFFFIKFAIANALKYWIIIPNGSIANLL